MSTAIWIVVLVVAVAAAVLATLAYARKRTSDQLRERFGPEYDRAMSAEGDRRGAERKLADIADRRDSLEITPLSDGQRADFARRWEAVQIAFVDQPATAADSADALITDVMRTRGYPVEDFDDRADLVAADHPQVVQHYRAAHSVHARNSAPGDRPGADTEQLRGALVHYRALFEQLIEQDATPAGGTGGAERDLPAAT